jgi:3-methyladenine DNA glycosylase/8-oxoguanine DNA glycosylase
MSGGEAAQTFEIPAPYDFDETLRFTRYGPGDPSSRRGPGWFAKAWRTRTGVVTLRLERKGRHDVLARAWGDDPDSVMRLVPALLGLHDDCHQFTPGPPLDRLNKRFRGLRLARVPWPLDKLLAYIFQQRVRFEDSAVSWRRIVWRHGDTAPGMQELRVPPPVERFLALGDEEWRAAGVDYHRQRAARGALRYANRIHETVGMSRPDVRRRLGALPGVGPWTVDMTMGFGFGDADAVPVGDYNLPNTVAYGLAGERRATDDRMLALLEPYAGQRFRVIRWLFSDAVVSGASRALQV